MLVEALPIEARGGMMVGSGPRSRMAQSSAPGATRRALVALPLLYSVAPPLRQASARWAPEPEVDPVPQEFLEGVRLLVVGVSVRVWRGGGWDTHWTEAGPPGGELVGGLGVRASRRGKDAAGSSAAW
jgi:hypothetical protein